MANKRTDINVEDCTAEAVDNIRADRQTVKGLIKEICDKLAIGGEAEGNYGELGYVLAKFVETMQRSNEQLVKLTSIMKKATPKDEELNDEDRESLREIMQDNSPFTSH
jgi:hypothetical protein